MMKKLDIIFLKNTIRLAKVIALVLQYILCYKKSQYNKTTD